MNRLLLSSFFVLSLSLFSPSVCSADDEIEYISVMITPAKPAHLRKDIYEPGIKGMRKRLGTTPDAAGYHWDLPMTPDGGVHVSLVTFTKGDYSLDHVGALRDLLQGTASLFPIQGYFLRPELWLHSTLDDGSVRHTHYVDPNDFTRNEVMGENFDPSVRSLDTLDQAGSFDSGHLVLRYATRGELTRGIGQFAERLKGSTSPLLQELEEKREKYSDHLIAHMTLARVLRCQGTTRSQTQPLTGNSLDDLKRAFREFRADFQERASAPNPMNTGLKVVPFDVSKIDLTTGIRADRKVVATFGE